MITLHHLENSRSQRIIWLLEELGVEYTVKRYNRDPQTRLAPESLKQVHPLGKSPVITDGERVVAETGWIIEYLLDTYGNGKFMPEKNSEAWFRYKYWLHAGEGSVMPPLVMQLVYTGATRAPSPFFIRPFAKAILAALKKRYINPTVHGNLALLEAHLAESEWIAGDELSGADFLLIFPIEAAYYRIGLENYPKLTAYMKRILVRPAYKRALEVGGPFELLG